MRRVSETGSGRVFLKPTLKDVLPQVADGRTNFMVVKRIDQGTTTYSQYRGGDMWKPSARGLGYDGDEFRVAISLLTRRGFLGRARTLTLRNDVGARWTSETSQVRLSLEKSRLAITCNQVPAIEGCAQFALSGRTVPFFERFNGWVRLDFTVADSFGLRRRLALFHDGKGIPWMGIGCGSYFSRIFMISSDGVRTRIIYGGSRAFNVAVLYNSPPDTLYSICWTGAEPTEFGSSERCRSTTGIVGLNRPLEQQMAMSGSAYDHGRLGAEIAFATAKELLKSGHVVLLEPSRGGKDLFSEDGKVVIQARMLVRTHDMKGQQLREEVSRNLKNLRAKLGQDFRHNTSAQLGLAVLTYADKEDVLNLVSHLMVRRLRQTDLRFQFEAL